MPDNSQPGHRPKQTDASNEPVPEKVTAVETLDHDFEQMFSPQELRKTWSQLRTEFERSTVPDVINHLDWRTTLDRALDDLSKRVINGTFEPTTPARYELAKTKGAFRVITGLAPPEALIYRHIANAVYKLYVPRKVQGAFFSKRHQKTAVGKTFILGDDDYEKFFAVWIAYSQYKTQTMLHGIYDRLVTTDISNFFESIQHDLLFEYLAPLGLPRKTVALLGRLLERFKPASGHSPNPKIGIPVDDLDCSRQLAHVFLFEHDHRIVTKFGEDNYVRWMDDQSVGVRGDTEARLAVNLLTRSLAEQRLTLNAGKTKFLLPEEVAVEFHLRTNDLLDEFRKHRQDGREVSETEIRQVWGSAVQGEGKGHWSKILKRFYGEFTTVSSEFLEHRALRDLIEFPDLDERIFKYFAARNRTAELVHLYRGYAEANECLFEATEFRFFEACSSIRAVDAGQRDLLVAVAADFLLASPPRTSGRAGGKIGALLLLYWLDGLDDVRKWSVTKVRELDAEVSRAWLACCAARYPDEVESLIVRAASTGSAVVARLAVFLSELRNGAVRVTSIANPKTHFPFVSVRYFDARGWLCFELVGRLSPLARNGAKCVWKNFARLASAEPEKVILDRVLEHIGVKSRGVAV